MADRTYCHVPAISFSFFSLVHRLICHSRFLASDLLENGDETYANSKGP